MNKQTKHGNTVIYLLVKQLFYPKYKYVCIYVCMYVLTITAVKASGVIIDRLLRQCSFVWYEIVGPHSSGNFNNR